jgi:hypothetical protein
MRKYRASNRIPFGSFILLVLLGAVGGAALGGVLWALDSQLHFYLVLLFPIVAGAILGGILAWGVRVGKVRSPFVAGIVGLLAGVLMFGVYHFAGNTITFRGEARDALIENSGKSFNESLLDRRIDEILDEEVGDTGFVGYLRLAAREGFSITRTSASSSGSELDLSGDVVFGYWALEILIAAAFAAIIAGRAAGQPFDEESSAWYGNPEFLAMTSTKSRKALLNALKDGDFQTAGSLLTTQDIKYPRMELMIRRAASATVSGQDIFLIVNQVQRKGRPTTIRSGVVSPSELDLMVFAMRQAASRQSPSIPVR